MGNIEAICNEKEQKTQNKKNKEIHLIHVQKLK